MSFFYLMFFFAILFQEDAIVESTFTILSVGSFPSLLCRHNLLDLSTILPFISLSFEEQVGVPIVSSVGFHPNERYKVNYLTKGIHCPVQSCPVSPS